MGETKSNDSDKGEEDGVMLNGHTTTTTRMPPPPARKKQDIVSNTEEQSQPKKQIECGQNDETIHTELQSNGYHKHETESGNDAMQENTGSDVIIQQPMTD